MILTIDFETDDPYIGLGLGSGWVYACKTNKRLFKLLGAAYKIDETQPSYTTNWQEVCEVVKEADTLIMHNAQYDIGCLIYLAYLNKDKAMYQKIRACKVLDTEILSRLYGNTELSHGLDAMSQKYLGLPKDNSRLINLVRRLDIFPYTKKDLAAKAKDPSFERQIDDARLLRFAKTHMGILQEHDLDTIAHYAIRDIHCTHGLANFFLQHLDEITPLKYSEMQKVCAFNRLRGIRVDYDRTEKVSVILQQKCDALMQELYNLAGQSFNINSPAQVAEVFDKHGIAYEYTDKGNPSITTPWLMSQSHPICQSMINTRKYLKIKRDFIDKILEMREHIGNADRFGHLYPEMHVLRAVTGRFSCTGPNIQQIPARDPVLGPLCRSIFVPEEGRKWYSLDYSNQEGRLQVHYAFLAECGGAAEFVEAFQANPNLDMHQKIADMAHISRREAKTINLGISYGMGKNKLAAALNVPVKEAANLIAKYNSFVPYLKELSDKCASSLKRRGYIVTLGSRKSYIDKPLKVEGEWKTFEYKALNKLIQGSAADQIMAAMLLAFKENLPVIAVIHDQMCLSGTQEQAIRLKEIMENACLLSVPSVVDLKLEGGNSWADAGH